jgi:hypothetical protein
MKAVITFYKTGHHNAHTNSKHSLKWQQPSRLNLSKNNNKLEKHSPNGILFF